MGKVFCGGAAFCRLKFALGIFLCLQSSQLISKPTDAPAFNRDPKQLVMMIADFDGSLTHNVGNYRVRRPSRLDGNFLFFRPVTNLPEEIQVPVHDYEGNVGPQIAKRLGKLDERGNFIPSTSLEPITLSNGQTIIPGHYYFDFQSSMREFSQVPQGEPGYLLTAVEEKIKKKEPFLLEGFPLFSVAMRKEYEDRVKGAVLTMRGHDPEEMRTAFGRIQKKLKLQEASNWPDEAFVNLSHPDFFEFAGSKVRYLERMFDELSDRVIVDKTTPHFLVMLENDRQHIADIDKLFTRLANRGVFSSPVVPVLVNLVEQQVLNAPDGHDWDRLPMREITKMSRVTVYWPGQKVERSNKLSRVLELTLGLTTAQADAILNDPSRTALQCDKAILGAL